MEDTTLQKSNHISPHKLFIATQISLRALAVAATLSASLITILTKETTTVFGFPIDARYSYSPAFKFFAYANLIACCFTIVSLLLTFILANSKSLHPTRFFYIFLHDLIMTVFLMAGCAAATAVGYIGKYGNNHSGWMAVCGYFAKFCNRVTVAAFLSYLGLFIYLMLTVISANKSRQIQV